MQVVRHTIEHTDDIRIYVFGDAHIGDPCCQMDAIREFLARVQNDKNGYLVCMGDLCNCAILGSKSDVYQETMTVQEQMDTAVELLRPLADAGKILGFVRGNHSARISRAVGADICQIIAQRLGIEDVYSPASALLFIRMGGTAKMDKDRHGNTQQRRVTYSIFMHHGHGGGKRAGSKINSLEDFSKIIQASVFIGAHTHQASAFRTKVLRPNPQNMTVSEQEQLFVNAGSFLQYDGGYGEAMGLPPQSQKTPVITLSGRTHKVEATV